MVHQHITFLFLFFCTASCSEKDAVLTFLTLEILKFAVDIFRKIVPQENFIPLLFNCLYFSITISFIFIVILEFLEQIVILLSSYKAIILGLIISIHEKVKAKINRIINAIPTIKNIIFGLLSKK